MVEYFLSLNPLVQALIAGTFCWGMNALGAGSIFLVRTFNQKMMDGILGFAGGVMIAASFWSLLEPSIAMSEGGPVPVWVPAVTGFLLGGFAIRGLDAVLPHLHIGAPLKEAEGIPSKWRRSTLLISAMTMHNIPEGLAVGVAFGAVALGMPEATMAGAIALAVGIGIQNFPEGMAVSAPLHRDGMPKWKAFNYGQLSAVVEPIFAVLGALLVIVAQPVLPYALSFAAGAMIFVVIEEVIPESHRNGNADFATMGGMIGFAVMMTLDVALG
ncbi:MAG: ZIP family metal transporter [Balneolales bacterium]|nr:ZIP family metal transporter [Balneolales bacterium]